MTFLPVPSRPAPVVAVVIPCYRVKRHILGVLSAIGPEVHRIYLVDDRCPEQTGDFVESECKDPRVRVVRNSVNLGVGGAVIAGYRAAIADGALVMVKLDGDGQMDPALIPQFIEPVLGGLADYAKGNRFFEIDGVESMPVVRRLGNLALSFLTKLSSGYWNIFDPTNGYTALHATAARCVPLDKISKRYFFESDMLFRLHTVGAVVCDIPMDSRYADERSGLRVLRVLPEFLFKNLRNLVKRIGHGYFLNDFNIASMELLAGAGLVLSGSSFGAYAWARSGQAGTTATAGTVMLAALPILVGVQLLLSFLNFDVMRLPTIALQRRMDPNVIRAAEAARAARRAVPAARAK